jgi:hypothetical protein
MNRTSPLELIVNAFISYVGHSKNILSEDEWSDSWYDFKKSEPFSTFIPYLFHTGLIPRETWEAYQKLGMSDISFSDLDKLVNKDRWYGVMDWDETALNQPHWRGSVKYGSLVRKGANLGLFIQAIMEEFEGKYMKEARTKQYWKEYVCMKEKDIDNLFDYMNM